MSGDGLRETCCPDLWDRINELESQLTEARATIARMRLALLEHKYDHGRFPFDKLMHILEVEDE